MYNILYYYDDIIITYCVWGAQVFVVEVKSVSGGEIARKMISPRELTIIAIKKRRQSH